MVSSFNFYCLKLRRLAWGIFDKKGSFYTKKHLKQKILRSTIILLQIKKTETKNLWIDTISN